MQNLLSVGVTKDSMQQMMLEWDMRRRTCFCWHHRSVVVDTHARYFLIRSLGGGKSVHKKRETPRKEKHGGGEGLSRPNFSQLLDQ